MQQSSFCQLQLGEFNFSVLELTGKETIGAPYVFTIDILADGNKFIPTSFLKTKAYLLLKQRTIAGIITKIKERIIANDGRTIVTITLESQLALTKLTSKCRIFLNQNLQEITETLLTEAVFQHQHIVWQTEAKLTKFTYLLQPSFETNYHFLRRHLFRQSLIIYSRTITADKTPEEQLVISKTNEDFPQLTTTLSYNPRANNLESTIKTITIQQRLTTTNISLTDHNLTNAQIVKTNTTHNQKNNFTHNYYGLGTTTQQTADDLTNTLKQAATAKQYKLKISSNIPDLAVGLVIQLEAKRFRSELSGKYLITDLEHSYAQEVEIYGSNLPYSNTAILHPLEIPFKLPLLKAPQPPPLMQATIEALTDEPYLDQAGNYRIRQKFNHEPYPTALASPPLPRLAPYGGPSNQTNAAGWHMPLHHGAEVMVSTINNNPDRPIILGTLPNVALRSPVTNNNSQQNIWRSYGGNELLMDDTNRHNKIRLSTKQQLNYCEFDPDQKQAIKLHSQYGAIHWQAKHNITTACYKNYTEHIQQSYLIEAKNCSITTKTGAIYHKSHKDINLTAANDLLLNAQEKIIIKCGRDLNIQAQENLSIESQTGNIQLQSQQGSLTVKAKTDVVIAGQGKGDIIFTNGQAAIRLTAKGNIVITANRLLLQAKTKVTLDQKINCLDHPPDPTQPVPSPFTNQLPRVPQLQYQQQQLRVTLSQIIINLHFDSKKQNAATNGFLDGVHYEFHNSSAASGSIKNSQIIINNIQPEPNQTLKLTNRIDKQAIIITAINGKTCLPQTTIKLTRDSFRQQPNHTYIINLTALHPPIISNIRHNKDLNSELLDQEQISFIRQQSTTITLFIHGFNVPYSEAIGAFGHEIKQVSVGEEPIFGSKQSYGCATVNNLQITIARDRKYLQQHFPQLRPWPDTVNNHLAESGNLNGQGAHNWFLHMEDNLNRAAHRITTNKYDKYQRLVNITWSGDPKHSYDYMDATKELKAAGSKLANLLRQLQQTNLTIDIIAHSLGCGVVLQAMEMLATPIINRVYLWEAAVPYNIFSADNTINGDLWSVPNAHKTAQKITILHSRNDNILGPIPANQTNQDQINQTKPLSELVPALFLTYLDLHSLYELAMWVGVSITDIFNKKLQEDIYQHWRRQHPNARLAITLDQQLQQDPHTVAGIRQLKFKLERIETEINKQLYRARHPLLAATVAIEEFGLQHMNWFTITTNHLGGRILVNTIMALPSLQRALGLLNAMLYATEFRPTPALGYAGPDQATLRQLADKLTVIDQTEYLWDHSAMKIPTHEINNRVYRRLFNKPKVVA